MNMDAQGHEANPKLEGEASPSPRGRPGRRGAEEKTQAVLELLSGKTTVYYRSISLAGIWPFLLDDDGRLN